MGSVGDWDRHAGRHIRRAADRVPGLTRAGAIAAGALAPAAHGLIGSLLVRPAARRTGVEALAGAAISSTAARLLRDAIGRPRPGARAEGGLPSRHAAAAVAIGRAVARRQPALAPWCALVVAAGLTGRVIAAHHDPADILAGGAVGWAADILVERVAGGRS